MSVLPHDVAQIQRILGLQNTASDSIDSLEYYSPVQTLNLLLPDEAALGRIDDVQLKLREDERAVRREIDDLQRELQRDQDPDRMQIIQELISELLQQMNRIREKATESEAIVRNITKDIQSLDLAKQNILQSMTALKRFHMLVNAIGQLEVQINQRQYREVSHTLSAVKEVASYFKQWTAVDQIASVWRRVQEIQGTLRTMLDQEFDAFFLQDKRVSLATLKDACLVVDIMGEDVKSHIIERYCSIELKEYRRIFRASDEAGQLDNISRRYAWFRRLLTSFDDEHSVVFPESWNVGQHLCARFADITRDDLVATLTKAAPTLTVALLLDALRQTLAFEQSMGAKFDTSFADLVLSSPLHEPKTISSAFDAHMGIFVNAQDSALSNMFTTYQPTSTSKLAPPRPSVDSSSTVDPSSSATEPESPQTVLPSSTELFYFYGQNLEQCAKLSNKGPLWELVGVWRKWLRVYAEDVLLATMRRTDRERKSLDGRMNLAEIQNIALVLNTADYCQVTAAELETKLKEKISEEYQEKVSFQPEIELFVSVISAAITSLLQLLSSSIEPHLLAMTKALSSSNLSSAGSVSSQSLYMTEMVLAVQVLTDAVRELVEKKTWLRNFYDKASSMIIAKFTQTLVKSRPIKESGAEQLLLDLQALKTCLLKLPGSGASDSALGASYARGVNSSTTKLETLFKVILKPVDPPEDFVLNYTLLANDSSFSNFQKILDLKGVARATQDILHDAFLTITSTKDELEPTSFLSQLDMDPDASPDTPRGGLMSPPPGDMASTSKDGKALGTPEKREVFSDFRRLVSFAVRRDREGR